MCYSAINIYLNFKCKTDNIRLPETARPLLNQMGLAEDDSTTYAVCPKVDCQKLKRLTLLPLETAVRCDACHTDLNRAKRTQAPQTGGQKYLVRLKYSYFNVENHLCELLSRPDIRSAISTHREYLRRKNWPDEQMETFKMVCSGRPWRRIGSSFWKTKEALDLFSCVIGAWCVTLWFKLFVLNQ